MITDILVNLPVSGTDVVTRFAATVAGHFGAHLTGVAFVYEPVMPMVEIGAAVPQRLIDEELAEARQRAQSAADRFRFEVRGEDISTSFRQIEASPDSAPRPGSARCPDRYSLLRCLPFRSAPGAQRMAEHDLPLRSRP